MRSLCFSFMLLGGTIVTWPAEAQTTSDVFSSQGEYDQHAVGNAHRWYDKHSADAKQKSSRCLSILDEAKVFQDKALALDEEARRPGLAGRQATALRKQANEQFGLRDRKIRAFIDCFNQASRQTRPPSDQFATGEGSPPSGDRKKQPGEKPASPSSVGKGDGQKQAPRPTPAPRSNDPKTPSDVFSTKGDLPTSDDLQTQPPSGDKSMKRTPKLPDEQDATVTVSALKETSDDCFKKFIPNYPGTDWSRFTPESRRARPIEPFLQSFDVSGAAADQALDLDEAVYGKWKDRELVRDYLVGWLTHCLADRNVLPLRDPRISYRDFMIAHEPPDNVSATRITERFEEFGFGYRSYPLPPFWDHDAAGTPPPSQ